MSGWMILLILVAVVAIFAVGFFVGNKHGQRVIKLVEGVKDLTYKKG